MCQQNKRIETKCDFCNKQFSVIPSQYNKTTNHYCSQECWRKDQYEKMAHFNCENCNKEVSQNMLQYNANKHHFCCHKCRNEFKKKNLSPCKLLLKCANCNKEFMRFRTMKTSNVPCCSVKCKGEYRTKFGTGKKELTVPLRKLIKNCKLYDNWRESIFKRDNFKCTKCKKSDGIHAHHKKSFSIIFNEFLNHYNNFGALTHKVELLRLSKEYHDFWDINNGITLCEDCHQKEHPNLKLTLNKAPCKRCVI